MTNASDGCFMHLLSAPRLGSVLILGLVCLGTAESVRAAPIDGTRPVTDSTNLRPPCRVQFESADKVQLHGVFYPSPLRKDAACVLLLHRIGGNSQQEGWDALATELQRNGFAVLRFDFR